MCIAMPGKVIQIINDKVVVDYGDYQKVAHNLINAKVGDYIIVQVGRVVQKVDKEDALKSIKVWKSNQ